MHQQQNNGRDVPLDRVKIRRFKKVIRNGILNGQRYVPGLSVRIDEMDLS
jgi:hypothetical protein